jgi:hypothetical protein
MKHNTVINPRHPTYLCSVILLGTGAILTQRCEYQGQLTVKRSVLITNGLHIGLYWNSSSGKEAGCVETVVIKLSNAFAIVRPVGLRKRVSETGPVSFLKWGGQRGSCCVGSIRKTTYGAACLSPRRIGFNPRPVHAALRGQSDRPTEEGLSASASLSCCHYHSASAP